MYLMLTGMMCLPVLSHNPKEGEKSASPRKVLVLAERGGLHEGFTSAGLGWLEEQKERLHMELTVLDSAKEIPAGELQKYQMVLQLNYPTRRMPGARLRRRTWSGTSTRVGEAT